MAGLKALLLHEARKQYRSVLDFLSVFASAAGSIIPLLPNLIRHLAGTLTVTASARQEAEQEEEKVARSVATSLWIA